MIFNREDYDREILNELYELENMSQRNTDVFNKWLAGASQVELAKEYGLTYTRIGQIIHKMCRKYSYYVENVRDAESTDITKQGFSVRTYNALRRFSITDLKQIGEMTEEEFYNIRNFGEVSQKEVISALKKHGIHFKDSDDDEEKEENTPVSVERFCDQSFLRDNFDISDEYTPYTQLDDSPLEEPTPQTTDDYSWTYECPLYKILSSMKRHISEAINEEMIIRRDYCTENPSETITETGISQKIYQIYEKKLNNVSTFEIILPASWGGTSKELFTHDFTKLANKYNFNVKFIYTENVTVPKVMIPTDIKTNCLADICMSIRMTITVPFVFGNIPRF